MFTSQLEKAREAVDLANIRAAYAEAATEVLTNDSKGAYKQVTITQKEDGWKSAPDKIAGTLDVTTDAVGSKLGKTNTSVYVCVDTTGELSLATTAPAEYTEIK